MHIANAFVFEQFSAPCLTELLMCYYLKTKKYVNDKPEGNFFLHRDNKVVL